MQQGLLQESVAARVAAVLGELSPAQRQVAQFLLDGGPAVSVYSAAEIGSNLGVSDATVVRTARALGYAGLPELRRALAGSAEEPSLADRLHRTLAESTGSDSWLASSVERLLGALDVLVQQVPPERFRRAVDLIAAGRPVIWSGVGPSAHLAGYAQLLRAVRALLTHSGLPVPAELDEAGF